MVFRRFFRLRCSGSQLPSRSGPRHTARGFCSGSRLSDRSYCLGDVESVDSKGESERFLPEEVLSAALKHVSYHVYTYIHIHIYIHVCIIYIYVELYVYLGLPSHEVLRSKVSDIINACLDVGFGRLCRSIRDRSFRFFRASYPKETCEWGATIINPYGP